jgi:hypothetical protein
VYSRKIPHPYLVRIITNRVRAVKGFLSRCAKVDRDGGEGSFQRRAGQIQELVEGIGDGFAVGPATVIVEEDDWRVFCALVGGGDPIPGASAGGGKTKAGAQFFFVGRLVERFEVKGLETIDLPVLWPPGLAAGLFQLEADGLDGGFVLVQAQQSLWQKLTQFFFYGVGLWIHQAAQVGLVGCLELTGGWP